MSERQGVEIDYCPQCRGVWLDRGELDKIIERSVSTPLQAPAGHAPIPDHVHKGDHHDYGARRYSDDHHYHKRHKSWLSELFD